MKHAKKMVKGYNKCMLILLKAKPPVTKKTGGCVQIGEEIAIEAITLVCLPFAFPKDNNHRHKILLLLLGYTKSIPFSVFV